MKFLNHSLVFSLSLILFLSCSNNVDRNKISNSIDENTKSDTSKPGVDFINTSQKIDTAAYNQKMLALGNNDKLKKWPVKTTIYPNSGALLPNNRIIAFYGNLYSKRMGILGELPKDEMLKKLLGEVKKWQLADSTTNTIPALHYIASTAQSAPGKGNKYRLRMPFHQIDIVMEWAKSINAIVFLDVQIGHSSVKEEAAALEEYLKLPNVHFGVDPEFSMKTGAVPGTKIGTCTADDINDAIDILANLVREYKLPPKVLVVHRFTQGMLTDYKKIKITPEVQIVIDMDGFGTKVLKKDTYMAYIYKEPVQFTGFKLFYKNDTKTNPNGLYTPDELLKFTPIPSYIQYQ
ncbi:MAG: hypothetical protein ACOH1N_03395 [Lutibacter sp.]